MLSFLKKKSLFNKNIDPKCDYCHNFTKSTNKCTLKGDVEQDHSCPSFSYDPLKRVPRKPKPMTGFTHDDFKL